mmetsp:Transcript_25722/g.96855  ORF Transcript_25722/g.96855 Transcript_25722/m.96855 type:complete len:221 (-) Transcript_25722:145-807(-)
MLVCWIHHRGKLEIGQRVLVAAEHSGGGVQARHGAQGRVHLLGGPLEEAPAAAHEQCVPAEQSRSFRVLGSSADGGCCRERAWGSRASYQIANSAAGVPSGRHDAHAKRAVVKLVAALERARATRDDLRRRAHDLDPRKLLGDSLVPSRVVVVVVRRPDGRELERLLGLRERGPSIQHWPRVCWVHQGAHLRDSVRHNVRVVVVEDGHHVHAQGTADTAR